MAKIDTKTIEGYADMTAEQKLAALEGFEIPDPDLSGYVPKSALDKATHDAAEWKRQFRATQDENQRQQAEQADAVEALKAERDSLLKEKTISGYVAKYAGLGYPEELAISTANALAEGDMDKVFANQTKFLGDYAKSLRAESMKNTPRPPVGAAESGEPDYQAKANEALAAGDMIEAAKYMRLAAEQNSAE